MDKEQEFILNQPDGKTNKNSFLINQRRGGSLQANKLYNHFLRIVLSEYKGEESSTIFYTTATEMKKAMGGNPSTTDIKKAHKQLMKLEYEPTYNYEKQDVYKTSDDVPTFPLIGALKPQLFKGLYAFDMSALFLEHLMLLKDLKILKYASLEDKYIVKFKKKFSLIFYELFMDYKSNYQGLELSELELRQFLDLEDKYPNFQDLKRYAVKTAIDEINSETNLNIKVTYEQKLEKRKIVNYVNFKIREEKHDTINLTALKKAIIKHWDINSHINIPSLNYKDLKLRQNPKTYKVYLTEQGADLTPKKAKDVWQYLFEPFIDGDLERQDKIINFLGVKRKEFFETYEEKK